MIVRGLFHLHTRVSKDATLTLEDHAEHARSRGLSFLLFGEHRDRMSDDEVRETAARCDVLSTDDLLLVPGQEQECLEPIYYHIVGVGVREPILATEPLEVVAEIRARGGPDTPGDRLPELREAGKLLEWLYVDEALRRHGGNVSAAARQAGISRPNFHRKLRELGFATEDYRKKS